jgi:hypothetical protein
MLSFEYQVRVERMNASALATKPSQEDGDATGVLALRRAFYEDGEISRDEVLELFRLADGGETDEEFAAFFVEAVTDYVVRQVRPSGYVTHETSDWLIDLMQRDGRVCSHCELSALVSIFETATLVPEQLVMFALKAVKTAVVSGDGRVLGQGYLQPGMIGETEVSVIRRIISAAGGSNAIRVSREEAEFLFDLNDLIAQSENHPEWETLFAQAIGNYLMAANIYTPLPRARAEDLEKWAEDTTVEATSFMSKLFSSKPDFSGVFGGKKEPEKGLDPQEWYAQKNERTAAEMAEAAPITEDEAAWVVARIGRDGKLSKAEIALLQFIKANSPSVHQKLQILFEQVRPWKAKAEDGSVDLKVA